VRVLHRKSFVDDPTRLLRAVRFEQRFGFHMDAETQALAKEAAQTDLLHRLSGSRLRAEVVRLLSEPTPRKSLVRLRRLGLLQFLHPTLQRTTRIDLKVRPVERALKWYRRQWPDRRLKVWLLYWMTLMDLLPTDAMERLLARLSFPKHEASAIRGAHAELGAVLRRLRRHPSPSPAVRYRLLHGLPEETLLMMIVKTESNSVKRQLLAYMTTYRYIKPTLTGIDLQTLGVKPGPVFAILFTRLLEGRLNGSLTSVDDERALVRRVVRAYTSRAPR
jgi:tRNA nucleotidyltransferase (CCA-adding enzyme)